MEIEPPVELVVNLTSSPTATVADDSDNSNSGIAGFTVNVKRCVALPEAFVAVTKNVVVDFTKEGLPDSSPVNASNDIPAGLAEIVNVAAPPVDTTVNPAAEPCPTI